MVACICGFVVHVLQFLPVLQWCLRGCLRCPQLCTICTLQVIH